jgi:ABC-2 type transport system permease protein
VTARKFRSAVFAQTLVELRLTLRRGESVLVTLLIPPALLLFFASARVLPAAGRSIDFLLPGTLTLAVVAAGLVSLGIATAYERYYGVLKLLGATPLPRSGIVAAKILSVLALEGIQTMLLIGLAALFFSWRPHGSIFLAIGALILGTLAFAGLGLAMAGALRAEATLAAANGLFLFFLLLGGLFVPLDHIPAFLATPAKLLPATALADVLRSVLRGGGSIPAQSGLVLIAWAVLGPAVASRTFRWE